MRAGRRRIKRLLVLQPLDPTLISNRHAFDGDALAAKTGSFTTPTPVTDAVLRQGRARPRAVSPEQVSTLIVKVLRDNRPVANVPVRFEVLSGSRGDGAFNDAPSAEVLSDAAGRASALFKGTRRGMVRIKVSSPAATNTVNIAVVVEGSLW